MRTPLLALTALAATVAASGSAPSSARASDFWEEVRTPGLASWRGHVDEAQSALEDRRWSLALEAADRAVATLDERALGHVLRGHALGGLGREQAAVEAFLEALDRDPKSLDGEDHGPAAARIAARAGRYDLAARVLDRVLGRMRVSKERYELYVLYGDVLLARGPKHLGEAILAYREGLRASQHVGVRGGLGLALALLRDGRELEATDLARRAAGQGRVEAAVSALPLPPAEKAARRAVALAAVGDTQGARAAWREAAESEVWGKHARKELGGASPGASR